MPNDDHPILKAARNHAPDLPEDRGALYEAAAVNSAMLQPQERVVLIEQIERELQGDEGSLRERAQLLALRRRVTDAHYRLLAAKR